MISIFIRYLFIHSLCHSLSTSIIIWLGKFILFILPLWRNLNTIVPKIITYSMSLIISYLWIMLVLFIWYYSSHCYFHSLSLSIAIFSRIIIVFLIFFVCINFILRILYLWCIIKVKMIYLCAKLIWNIL